MLKSSEAALGTAWNWESLRAEPYRMLFPLGLACAVIGIGIWIPFYFLPQVVAYPGQAHAILQIQGFLLCFILGFLLTMLPKVMGVRHLGRAQSVLFPAGIVAASLCAWSNAAHSALAAQAVHLFLVGNFLFFMARRWRHRKATPPATFVFIPLAFAADTVGTVLRILISAGSMGAEPLRFASLLQFQAFPLLLILGIGGFLLPKLFGNAVADPAALRDQPGHPLYLSLAMGAVLLGSFALEAFGSASGSGTLVLRLAYLLRTAVWAWFALGQLRLTGITRKLPAYLAAARLSLFSMGLGMAMPVILPAYLLAWEHVIFITGFLWLTLSVAARVLTSHGGNLGLLDQHRKKSLAYGYLFAIAMVSRVATDIWTGGHWMHLALASAFALTAMGLWARIYLPFILLTPSRKT
jgi:uncharacterized protein involved in response to NO